MAELAGAAQPSVEVSRHFDQVHYWGLSFPCFT